MGMTVYLRGTPGTADDGCGIIRILSSLDEILTMGWEAGKVPSTP